MEPGRPLACITGASSGIGATFARKLAARGYDLLLVARRKDRLEQVAAELSATKGAGVEVLVADLAAEAELAMLEGRLAAAGNLDLLVNNAGFGTVGRFFDTDPDGQDRMHRLHIIATMRLSGAALRSMAPRRRGGIINVASVAGFWISPGNTSYCATKAWMNAFTEGLYLELRSAGSPVRVQALCPGYTITEFHDVMGVDRGQIPRSWWMSADAVVEESLRGLDRGRLFVVPGWRYKIAAALPRLLPQRLKHAMLVKYSHAAKRDSSPRR